MSRLAPAVARSPSGSPAYSPNGVSGYKGSGLSWRAAFERDLMFFGDSRTYACLFGLAAGWADTKGLDITASKCGQGITAAGTGTLEFRASDGYLRWTAPGDAAGPWTAGRAGVVRLESATADSHLDLSVLTYSANPGTDQTISATIAGTYALGWHGDGYVTHAMNKLKWLNTTPVIAGISGNSSPKAVEQLAYLEAAAGSAGVDVILLGTNDIDALNDIEDIKADLRAVFAARRAVGRKLVLVGEPARWGASLGVAMPSNKQTLHEQINTFLSEYAAANGCLYVDTYAATVDTNYTDRRPIAGLHIDAVHPNETGACLIGDTVADAIAAAAGVGSVRDASLSPNLITTLGEMSGTGGTAGTGASGSVATSWTVNRLTGDATIVASKEARGTGLGDWQVVAWSSTTAGRIQCFLASQSLASLGLSVGDEIYCEAEIVGTDFSGVYNIRFHPELTSGAMLAYNAFSALTTTTYRSGARTLRSRNFKIPTGTTAIVMRVQIEHRATSSGTIKVGSAAIVRA